jgi:hypothetical protein
VFQYGGKALGAGYKAVGRSTGLWAKAAETTAEVAPKIGKVVEEGAAVEQVLVSNVKSVAKMEAVREVGKAGEAAAGIVGKKTGVFSPLTGKMRFPDQITKTVLTEVKNVVRQGWTAQLKDYSAIAKSLGVDFELLVRESTILSKPLKAAEDAGKVIIKYLKGL